jgi:hypothetical protein
MAVLTFDLLDLLAMMTICTILLKGFPMSFSAGVTVRTLQAIASHMGFMREFDIVKRDCHLLYPHMAEGSTGHPGLKFLGLIIFVDGR